MLAIMLGSVLIDRRALTLRNVALSALVILLFSPDSLLSISFQMSFAATVALIAAYEALASRSARLASDTAPIVRRLRDRSSVTFRIPEMPNRPAWTIPGGVWPTRNS